MSTLNRLLLVVAGLVLGTARAERIHVMRPVRPESGESVLARPGGAGGLIQTAGTAPVCGDKNGTLPCVVEMTYFGGPVISNVKVYAVLWDATVSAEVAQGIGDFYRAFTGSEFFDWLSEYSTNRTVEAGALAGRQGTGQIIGRGTFGGTFRLPALSGTYPACPVPDFSLTCVTDAKIAAELQWQVTHGNLPQPDGNTLYVVHLPASIRVNDSRTPFGSVSCKDYCAYHSVESGGSGLAYAVIPDLGSNGCETGCGKGTVFENTCASASHEIAEAVTDVDVTLATSQSAPLAWYDDASPSQGEIGDMCNQSADTVGADGRVGCTGTAPDCFVIQRSFSRTVWDADPAGHPDTPACIAARYADSGDFAMTFKPNTLTIAVGETSAPIPVLTGVTTGTAMAIALSATDVPPGLHVRFDPGSIRVGDAATLTVSADADASPLTDAVLVVRATGAQVHSAAILVQLTAPPNDWTLSLTPASSSVLPGGTLTYVVSGQVTSGKAETVTLSSTVSGLPEGLGATFDRTSFTPGTSTATLTLTASKVAVAAGPTTFTVKGTSLAQPLGHSASAQVEIQSPPKAQTGCSSSGAGGAVLPALVLLAGLARRGSPRRTRAT